MNKKLIKLVIEDEFIKVYYKKKQLFKVSNNVDNAKELLKLYNR